MAQIPRDQSIDSTLALLRQGFPFIQKRCKKLGSDIFQTRIMFRKVICISGEDAARIFYDSTKFTRHKAVSKRIKRTFLGEGTVKTLDDSAHVERKALIMSLMNKESIDNFSNILKEQWFVHAKDWEKKEQIVLLNETKTMLCRTACLWAGIPIKDKETDKRTQHFWAILNSFGAIGPRQWKGRIARMRVEKWIGKIVEEARSRSSEIDPKTPAGEIIFYTGSDGKLLPIKVVVAEIINLLQPIVGIAIYIVFAALALYEHPQHHTRLQSYNEEYLEMFVNEVRRFYPLVPFIGAKVRKNFFWRGFRLRKGQRVLLDIYGTNHDPRKWERPKEFWPLHFKHWHPNLFSYIPQGGGEYMIGHRCGGEQLTVEALKTSINFLVKQMEYEVVEQNLSYDLHRMPSFVKSGFVITTIKIRNNPSTPFKIRTIPSLSNGKIQDESLK